MKFKLTENTSRIYNKLSDSTECAIISPFRYENTDEENQIAMTNLKKDVRSINCGFNQFISRWVENGISFDESSLLIYPISFKNAIELGKKYNQSSIIFKDKSSCREICTTEFVDVDKNGNEIVYHPNDTVRTFLTTGNNILNIEDAKSIFARKIAGAASIPIKGSNKKPFTLKPEVEDFELYEMLQPSASTFSDKYRYIKIF